MEQRLQRDQYLCDQAEKAEAYMSYIQTPYALFSGPDYTEKIEVRDQGATELVAVRDRLPLDQAQQRFMRLKVKRWDRGGV